MGMSCSARTAPLLAIASIAFTISCATSPTKGLVPVTRTMTVTAYCPCKSCCGWERTWYGKPVHAYGASKGAYKKPGRTASGKKAKTGTIAADGRYAFGTIMDIPGYGRGEVLDRGGAIQGDTIDVFFKRHRRALEWGRQTLPVTVWVRPTASAGN